MAVSITYYYSVIQPINIHNYEHWNLYIAYLNYNNTVTTNFVKIIILYIKL